MKAFVLRSYGPPEALELTDVARPVPAADEVLVRVRATSVQPYDWHHLRGEPYVARLMPGTLGLRTSKISVLGADLAGEVEAVGAAVTDLRPGDEVFALAGRGGFAEYARVGRDVLAPKPRSLSFEQAAAVPLAAVTALHALRDQGHLEPGQRVLVNGASGGVGTFAVQLAKAFGAHVTGVCGTRNVELVRSIGADEVIDYTAQDFTRTGERYDLLLDNAGSHSVRSLRRAMTPSATCVVVGGPAGRWLQPVGHVLAAAAVSPLLSQRVVVTQTSGYLPRARDLLLTLTELIEDGRLTPVIDRTYPFADLPAAMAYQEEGHASGKVVVTV
ncbi:NAD(P)-dependent alcohol dehydrogenase [Actinophytocola xanthii]|uniref:Alcohol dehydrogenase n=1 Tax=Actinophytocola xanthii TaxID=1912961 RepID=A0A1Q8CXR9_9PSEU|nr:NAD(P)-dependent alcohol dehydrogenase [Actinophytocola xanthii]OLF19154.1 alcohol dehydrogenase [Actinophytocola xanthii]